MTFQPTNPIQQPCPTPKKLAFQDDENLGPLADRMMFRPERTSLKEIQGQQGHLARGSTQHHPKAKSEAAVAPSDISTGKLKGWLNDSGPVRTTKFAVPVSKRQDVVIGKGPSMTPVRFKTHFEDVQATDDGYASVKKLASWLADDPTKRKEVVGHVRKGINVISKSRKFDKDLEDVILDEDDEDVAVATVKMQNAFGEGDSSHVSVADKKKWLQAAFPRRDEEDNHFDDETSTEVSVTDKKKWLENAFGKKAPSRPSSVANSCPPVMMSIKASAKDKWRQKRQSLNVERQENPEIQEVAPFVEFQPKALALEPANKIARVDATAKATEPDAVAPIVATGQEVQPKPIVDSQVDWRKSLGANHVTREKLVTVPKPHKFVTNRTKPNVSAAACQPQQASASDPVATPNVEISSDEVVDFKAARELLVQRGEKNGNPVMLSKVQMRKAKFEKWEHDLKKGSGAHGRLKSAWEQAAPSKGPSDKYIRSYVSDIAPKRSFDELP